MGQKCRYGRRGLGSLRAAAVHRRFGSGGGSRFGLGRLGCRHGLGRRGRCRLAGDTPGSIATGGRNLACSFGLGRGSRFVLFHFCVVFDYAAKLGARLAGIITNRAPKGRLTLIFYSIPKALQLPFELLAGHGAQALQGAVVGVVDGSRRDSELCGKLLLEL